MAAEGRTGYATLRMTIVWTAYLLMTLTAAGWIYGMVHDWMRVGWQWPRRALDWFLVTIWFVDIVAFYGIARGVQRQQLRIVAASLVPLVVSIVAAIVLSL